MLVVAAGGAAHILVRGYGLAAARARPPGGVQFVVFGIQAGLQEVFLGDVDVFSGFDAGQRKGCGLRPGGRCEVSRPALLSSFLLSVTA